MNYVERHFGDWARDTAHLSMLEDGAYNRLVDLYYVREAPLPSELAACCRLVRAVSKQEREAVASVLREFFALGDDGWTHKRCDAEIDKFRTKSGKARASAQVRWGADRSQSEGNATAYANASPDAMRTHSEGNATRGRGRARPQPPSTKHQSSEAKLPAAERASRLPPDWTPGEDGEADAVEAGLMNGRIAIEAAKFRDYWVAQPGQKGVKLDWPATWRNWCRRAAEPKPGQQQLGGNAWDGAR